MFCEKCGSQIDENSVFCPKCGKKQTKAIDISSNNEALNKKRPKKSKTIIAVIILFLTAAIVAIVFIVNVGNNTYGENNNPPIGLAEASASDFEYEYDADLGGVVITKYLRIAPKVRIPKKIEGKPVVGIDGAFSGTDVTEVYIPNSVTEIGDSAFAYCKNLTNITIPDSVTEIGSAFEYCTSLTSIILPEGLEVLGNHAFSYCTNLTSVTLPDSLTTIGCQAFFECPSLTSLTIPNGVTSIDLSAFDETSITSIELPDNVQSVTNSPAQSLEFIVIYKGESYTSDVYIRDGKFYTSYYEFYNSFASENLSDTERTPSQPTDYSTGHYVRVVPDLKGMTLEDAEQKIIGYDLSYGGYTEEESSAPKGTVLRQSPQAGTEVTNGATITLVVSLGS